MKHVEIYTDGACKGNPGPGGWSAVIVYGGAEKELSGGEAATTNNRMELIGAISGLGALKEPCEVTFCTRIPNILLMPLIWDGHVHGSRADG